MRLAAFSPSPGPCLAFLPLQQARSVICLSSNYRTGKPIHSVPAFVFVRKLLYIVQSHSFSDPDSSFFFFFSWPKWVFGYTCLKYFPSSSSGGHALWRRIPDLQSPLVFVQTRPHTPSSGASSAHPPGGLPALSLVLGWGPSVFPSRYPARPQPLARQF